MNRSPPGAIAAASSLNGSRLKVIFLGEGGIIRDVDCQVIQPRPDSAKLANYLPLSNGKRTQGTLWTEGGRIEQAHPRSKLAVCTVERLDIACAFFQLPDTSIVMRRFFMGTQWKWENGGTIVVAANSKILPDAGTSLVVQPSILRAGTTSGLKLFYQTTDGTLVIQRINEAGMLQQPAFITRNKIPRGTPFTALSLSDGFRISFATLDSKEIWECSGTLALTPALGKFADEIYTSVAQKMVLSGPTDLLTMATYQAERSIVYISGAAPSSIFWSSSHAQQIYHFEENALSGAPIALAGNAVERSCAIAVFVNAQGGLNIGRLDLGANPTGGTLPKCLPIPLPSAKTAFGWLVRARNSNTPGVAPVLELRGQMGNLSVKPQGSDGRPAMASGTAATGTKPQPNQTTPKPTQAGATVTPAKTTPSQAGPAKPQGTRPRPQAAQAKPQAAQPKPPAGQPKPPGPQQKPPTSSPQTQTTPSKPQVAPPKPQAAPSGPQATQPKPPTAQPGPQAAPPKPSAAPARPDAAPSKPNGAPPKPNAASATQAAQPKPPVAFPGPPPPLAKPQIAPPRPNVALPKPNVASSKPNAAPPKPNAALPTPPAAPPKPQAAQPKPPATFPGPPPPLAKPQTAPSKPLPPAPGSQALRPTSQVTQPKPQTAQPKPQAPLSMPQAQVPPKPQAGQQGPQPSQVKPQAPQPKPQAPQPKPQSAQPGSQPVPRPPPAQSAPPAYGQVQPVRPGPPPAQARPGLNQPAARSAYPTMQSAFTGPQSANTRSPPVQTGYHVPQMPPQQPIAVPYHSATTQQQFVNTHSHSTEVHYLPQPIPTGSWSHEPPSHTSTNNTYISSREWNGGSPPGVVHTREWNGARYTEPPRSGADLHSGFVSGGYWPTSVPSDDQSGNLFEGQFEDRFASEQEDMGYRSRAVHHVESEEEESYPSEVHYQATDSDEEPTEAVYSEEEPEEEAHSEEEPEEGAYSEERGNYFEHEQEDEESEGEENEGVEAYGEYSEQEIENNSEPEEYQAYQEDHQEYQEEYQEYQEEYQDEAQQDDSDEHYDEGGDEYHEEAAEEEEYGYDEDYAEEAAEGHDYDEDYSD